MPSAISCPACKRVLNLPAEALNQRVQCPACKHQFHPAEAVPVEFVRPAGPRFDQSAPPATAPAAPAAVPANAPRPLERRPTPPAPPGSFDVRRSARRGKRDVEDLCPSCQAFVPRGVDTCPECRAEFEPEDDADYRPWEREGMERRDSVPHRGGMLLSMGIASLITPVFFFICFLGPIITLAGLIVASATVWMSRVDMNKMREHVMNREGHGTTSGALVCGLIGIALNLLALPAAIGITAMAI